MTKSKSTASSKKSTPGNLKISDLKEGRNVMGGSCVKGEHLKDAILTARK